MLVSEMLRGCWAQSGLAFRFRRGILGRSAVGPH